MGPFLSSVSASTGATSGCHSQCARADGRLLVTDLHVGPLRPPKGWLWRAFAVGAEVLAWHLNRSWAFLRAGGVPAMAARHGLDVEQAKVVSAGNIGLYLLQRPNA